MAESARTINSNQLIVLYFCFILFSISFLLPEWVTDTDSNISGGMFSLRIEKCNMHILDDKTSIKETKKHTIIPWDTFCSLPVNTTICTVEKQMSNKPMTLINKIFKSEADDTICNEVDLNLMIYLLIFAASFSGLSAAIGTYTFLYDTEHNTNAIINALPLILILLSAMAGVVTVAYWDTFDELSNGASYQFCLTATILAFIVSLTLAITSQYPGLFAVSTKRNVKKLDPFATQWNARYQPRKAPRVMWGDKRHVDDASTESTTSFQSGGGYYRSSSVSSSLRSSF